MVKTLVRNGRSSKLSLDTHSFQMVKQKTCLETEDFYNENSIVTKYYTEMADTIKKVTGAAAVQIYNHQVRNPERSNGHSLNVNTSVQGYAGRIHLDTHPIGCQETFKHFVNKLGLKELHQGRFMVLNAWRNISETPIQKDHLAVLDETSTVKPDDYITGDFFGKVNI